MLKWFKEKCLKLMKGQEGMTLIELIAVIVILGVIAAIAVPIIGNQIEKSRENSALQNLQIVQNALERYAGDHNGQYPASDLKTNLASYINGGIPSNPWGGPDLSYNYSASNNTYTIEYDSDNSGTPAHKATAGSNQAPQVK
jgi:prepilin-type N-terminal cleavage/methylation domain-containing protein